MDSCWTGATVCDAEEFSGNIVESGPALNTTMVIDPDLLGLNHIDSQILTRSKSGEEAVIRHLQGTGAEQIPRMPEKVPKGQESVGTVEIQSKFNGRERLTNGTHTNNLGTQTNNRIESPFQLGAMPALTDSIGGGLSESASHTETYLGSDVNPICETFQPNNSTAKRKRLQTADDLAAEEASRFGNISGRRRGAGKRYDVRFGY